MRYPLNLFVAIFAIALFGTDSFAQQRQPSQTTNNLRNRTPQLVAKKTPNIPRAPQAPFPPLDKRHTDYINQLLEYWEHSSGQIKRYKCKFTRWEYDAVFGPRVNAKGVMPAKTIATGVIRFESPDRGMYDVEKFHDYNPPKTAGGQPQYLPRAKESREKWICDGANVYEQDFKNKKMTVIPLPPEQRGKTISDGPLPFLFGVEAEKVKKRYWLRIITPKDVKGEYWLEAWPKWIQDAQSYKKVEVIIDEKDFLPKAIQIFAVNFNPRTNQSRTAFTFDTRQKNGFNIKLFGDEFAKPKVDKSWKVTVINPQIQAKARNQAFPK